MPRPSRILAIQAFLKEHPDWSNRRVAKALGVSHTIVNQIRRVETFHPPTPKAVESFHPPVESEWKLSTEELDKMCED